MPPAQSLPREEGGQQGCGHGARRWCRSTGLGAPVLRPQADSRKQRLGGHRGHGAPLQCGPEAMPACHQEETEAPSQAQWLEAPPAPEVGGGLRGRTEASLEGPHRSHCPLLHRGLGEAGPLEPALSARASPVQGGSLGMRPVRGDWLSLSPQLPPSLTGVDKPHWTLASEVTVHFQLPPGPYPLPHLCHPLRGPTVALSPQEPTHGISVALARSPGRHAASFRPLPKGPHSFLLLSQLHGPGLYVTPLTGNPAPELLPAHTGSCTQEIKLGSAPVGSTAALDGPHFFTGKQ